MKAPSSKGQSVSSNGVVAQLNAILDTIFSNQAITNIQTSHIRHLMGSARAEAKSSVAQQQRCRDFYWALHTRTEAFSETIVDQPGEPLNCLQQLSGLVNEFGTLCLSVINPTHTSAASSTSINDEKRLQF